LLFEKAPAIVAQKFYNLTKSQQPPKSNEISFPDTHTDEPNDNLLDCNVLVEQGLNQQQIFTVTIRGYINTDQPGRKAKLKVVLTDITDSQNPTPVYAKQDKDQATPTKVFEYTCDLGRLNQTRTHIADWLSVAKIEPQRMFFARQGVRHLQIQGSVFCLETNTEFAQCRHRFEYENPEYGYLDLAERAEHSRALAVTLTFALCAADGRIYKSEIDKIKEWAYKHLEKNDSKKARRQLEHALRKTIRFFKKGGAVDVESLSYRLTGTAAPPQRYEIIELCLTTVESKGFISPRQLKLLKELAAWLDIEPAKFRRMLEQLAPAHTHQVKDMELIFGLDEKLSTEQTKEKLNNEYRKWNARVTSRNPNIQNQAQQMLQLITEARNRYVN
jgi:uncharacterized tellurite resistance protein B-like protein